MKEGRSSPTCLPLRGPSTSGAHFADLEATLAAGLLSGKSQGLGGKTRSQRRAAAGEPVRPRAHLAR